MEQAPPPSPPQDRAAIESKVKGPAIGVIVAGALHVLGGLLAIIFTIIGQSLGAGGGAAQALPPEVQAAANIIGGILALIVGGIGIFGGMKMMNMQGWGLALTGSIVVMLPCTLCCLVGLPMGIWSIVVLSDAQVKATFT